MTQPVQFDIAGSKVIHVIKLISSNRISVVPAYYRRRQRQAYGRSPMR